MTEKLLTGMLNHKPYPTPPHPAPPHPPLRMLVHVTSGHKFLDKEKKSEILDWHKMIGCPEEEIRCIFDDI